MTPRAVYPGRLSRALKRIFLALVVVLVAATLFSPTLAAQGAYAKAKVMRGATSSKAFAPRIVRINVRSLLPPRLWRAGDPIKEIPKRNNHQLKRLLPISPSRPTGLARDPLLGQQERAAQGPPMRTFSTPALNFDGQPFSGANPPDTVGDVGPDHYIQMTNSSSAGALFRIYDKSTGQLLAGPTPLQSLGTGACTSGLGDPIVLYDRLADRWLLSEFTSSSNTLCVYVSMTGDPSAGGWLAYQFVSANSFPDYPKYAVWPDAYYMSSNESSPTVYAFDREAMLAGQPATFQSFNASSLAGFGFQALLPSDLDGPSPPPTGSPGYFMRHRDDEAHNPTGNDPSSDFLEIFEFRVDFRTPANSSFTGPLVVPVAEFDSELCGFTSFSCFAQPSGSNALDPLREVLMWRLQYRNFASHETLLGNFVTDVNRGDRGGIRWFELRKTANQAWQLFQEGTYSPDESNRWMGSIAMDGAGNIALGYSVGSAVLPAGLRYAGRQAGDPLGTMTQPEVNLVDGVGSAASVRWGDYSSMNVDPTDDCTFWFTSEYASNGLWATRIGSFSFEQCGQQGSFSLEGAPLVLEACSGSNLRNVTVTVGQVGAFSGPVTLELEALPPGFTGVFSMSTVGVPGTSTLSLSTDASVAAGKHTVVARATAPGATEQRLEFTVNVSDALPERVLLTAPTDGALDVALQPSFAWSSVSGALSYLIEIATGADFANLVTSESVTGTTYSPAAALSANTQYFWRVRASNACGTGCESTSTAFTTVDLSQSVCSTPDAEIPDNNSVGVTDTITLSSTDTIADLDVSLQVPHTWVGDVVATLTHVDTGTSVTLVDRPGFAGSGFGCSGSNYDVTLDDEASSPVEGECAVGIPAIEGMLRPQQSLGAFDGEPLAGTWTLSVSDRVGDDRGRLVEWCLLPNGTRDPEIGIDEELKPAKPTPHARGDGGRTTRLEQRLRRLEERLEIMQHMLEQLLDR